MEFIGFETLVIGFELQLSQKLVYPAKLFSDQGLVPMRPGYEGFYCNGLSMLNNYIFSETLITTIHLWDLLQLLLGQVTFYFL